MSAHHTPCKKIHLTERGQAVSDALAGILALIIIPAAVMTIGLILR
jgi:hypothetical protein